ncbi:MAG: Ig-like domain-containing protein [Candidatus Binatia bacterium]
MNRKTHAFAKVAVGRVLAFTVCIFLPCLSLAAGIDATINNQPIAANDTATTDQDTSIDINVLCNDSDPDGDPVTIVAVTPATHGLIKLLANGISYSPQTSFTGTDTFTYTIGDGKQLSASATVVITVNTASTVQNDAGTASSATAWGFE